MAIDVGAWLARAGQGMKFGSKLAPAYAMAKTAAPAMGGAIQGFGIGAGAAAGQAAMAPAKGILGWFADLKPDNLYGGMVVFAVLLYFLDFITGFDITRTAALRVFGFGIGGFFILAITGRYISFWRVVIAAVHFYSVYGLLNAFTGTFDLGVNLGVLTSLLTDKRTLIAFVLGSGSLYVNLKIPGAIKWLPVFMIFETYGLPTFRERILGSVANINYASFFVTFLLNRVLFPLPLMYSIFAFYADSRTARKILGLLIIVYLIAAIPQIKGAYTKYAGLTGVETEQAHGVLARLQTNVRSIVSGEIFRAPAASLYEKAEIAFGFGKPKEEPKMGLQLINNPNMQQEFDLAYKDVPAASVTLAVPNPLPLDLKQRYIGVTGIKCEDKSESGTVTQTTKTGKIDPPGIEPSREKPFELYYEDDQTGVCIFPKLAEHSVKFKVEYRVEETAYLETTIMRHDKRGALLAKQDDPAVKRELSRIPPAKAEYNNGPVAIRWDPPSLTKAPASNERARKIVVVVSNSGAWPGEFTGIEWLEVIAPQGVRLEGLDGGPCSFTKKQGDGNVYEVARERIRTPKPKDDLRLIGDKITFECGLVFDNSFLGGGDTMGARFDARGSFIFSTSPSNAVTFKVIDSGIKTTGPTPTQQQIKDKCTVTGGIWQETTSTCDCGTGKKWDAYPAGCVAA